MSTLLNSQHLTSSNRTMSAAVLVEPGRIEIEDVAIPAPGPGQVRIALEGCGVCASNLPPWEGRPWFKYPFAPGQMGHEGWGVIDAVGSGVEKLKEGDRVAALSENAYAQYDVSFADRVVKLPRELDGQAFPGEPLSCAMNIFGRSGAQGARTVAIVGIGFLGSLLTRLASRANGASVIAISRRGFSLDMAKAMGAAHVVTMDDHWKIIERIKELTGGQMCDVVIEAVGKQWPLDLAGELTAERGRLVVAGYHQDGPRQVNMQLWNWRGLDVINAHERDPKVYIDGMMRAVEAVVAGGLDLGPLLTHDFALEQLSSALTATAQREGNFMKALVKMA